MAAPAPTKEAAAPAAPVASENILSAKTDLCLSNAVVKGSIGLGAGIVASAILFRRRPWPVLMGLGFGLGQGYSDCERVFNPAAVPGFVVKNGAAPATPAPSPISALIARAAPAVNEVGTKAKEAVAEVKEKAVEVKDKAEDKKVEVEKKVEKKWV
ncbi:DUF543-domain-containing protein [Pseudohyphozyma bogoriensis]|nr:DUF543-domain-containing protein [Pseudohyphozyma bogoriensis]